MVDRHVIYITDAATYFRNLNKMGSVNLHVLGCGDAFSNGGRMQTCFRLKTERQHLLLDCGATSLLALKRHQISTSSLDHILISHLHGDHFGGLPFFLMDAHFIANRQRPLTIMGPPGTEERVHQALEILYPGINIQGWSYPLTFIPIEPEEIKELGDARIKAFAVDHPSGAPSLAFRIEVKERVIAFSGDTGWTKTLLRLAEEADLLILECHDYEPSESHHMDWQTLQRWAPAFTAKKILLTHMGPKMLAVLPGLDLGRFECAKDDLHVSV